MTFYKKHPIVFLIGAVLIIFLPILFTKKLLPGLDPLLVFYPYSFHFFNFRNFWSPSILNGFNIGLSPAGFAGNWIYYFFGLKFFDFLTFYHLLVFFYFILTTIFSYLAARLMGFDKRASVVISSVYVFSAYNLSWMVNIVTGASLFIFPALIYFLLKFKKNFNWIWPILGGFAAGIGFVGAHPQFFLIAILGGFFYSVFLALEQKPIQLKFLLAFIVICFIGLSLAAFQLIPEYQISQASQRGAALTFGESQECALGPFDFARYLIPGFALNTSCESLLYVGVLPLLLAALAVIYLKTNKNIFFWAGLFAFAILFSVRYSPFAWAFHQLPVWDGLRGPARFMMLGNFAIAVLAGFGYNWILENKGNFKDFGAYKRIKNIFYGYLAIILTINISGIFKGIFIRWAKDYFDKYYYSRTIGLPLENYHRSIENLISGNFFTFNFFNRYFLVPFILAGAAFLTIIFIKRFNKNSLFGIILLSGFIWAVFSPMISSGTDRDFFSETEIVKFLKNQEPPFRIYSLMPNLSAYQLLVLAHSESTEADQNEFLKLMMPPNLNIVHGFDSIDGYEAAMPERTAKILAELLSERAAVRDKIANARFTPEEKVKIFESRANLLRMMNVKYIVSAFPLNEKIFERVFETKATRFNVPVYVYENKSVLPRFYFAKSVKPTESDELKALDQILKFDINFSAEAFIECGNDCGQNSGGKILDFEYKNGYLRMNTESQTGGWLIFSESFDRNWQAKINDSTVPIYRANYIHQAIQVSKGKNIVVFIYMRY